MRGKNVIIRQTLIVVLRDCLRRAKRMKETETFVRESRDDDSEIEG